MGLGEVCVDVLAQVLGKPFDHAARAQDPLVARQCSDGESDGLRLGPAAPLGPALEPFELVFRDEYLERFHLGNISWCVSTDHHDAQRAPTTIAARSLDDGPGNDCAQPAPGSDRWGDRKPPCTFAPRSPPEYTSMTMQPLKAFVKNGRLVLDEPTDLPEGEIVYLQPVDTDDQARLREALRESVQQMKAGQTLDGAEALAELRAHR